MHKDTLEDTMVIFYDSNLSTMFSWIGVQAYQFECLMCTVLSAESVLPTKKLVFI